MANEKSCPICGKPLGESGLEGLCPECMLKAGFPTGTEPRTGGGGSSFAAPSVEAVRKLFPHLEVIEMVGRGGMGAVYKARQKKLDRLVALKILPPGIGDDRAFADRFVREAKALAKLNHSNIVTLYEFDQADGLFYFIMEFVDGVNLRQLLQAGRLAPREALAIVPQICDALQYAHDHGIVHRDIKPENILLDRKGQVKVADFGVARLMGVDSLSPSDGERAGLPSVGSAEEGERGEPLSASVSLTEAGKVMGTPQYMAPEQKTNPTEVDHRADIYSLGVVFYQMLTGELPGKRIEPPSRKVHLDVRLDEVVLRALEKDPARRYQQANVLKTEVETVVTSPLDATTEQTPVGRAGVLSLSPFPKLLPGERVVDFRGCIWRLSGKSVPSYRLFFSLPPLWRAALHVTDRRLVVVANAFWLINQEFSVWFREDAQTRNHEFLKDASAGKNSFGSYVEVISENKSARWYRSRRARTRIYARDSELLVKTVLGAVKGEVAQAPA